MRTGVLRKQPARFEINADGCIDSRSPIDVVGRHSEYAPRLRKD